MSHTIVIKNAPGENPQVIGAGAGQGTLIEDAAFLFYGCRNVWIEGLEIIGESGFGTTGTAKWGVVFEAGSGVPTVNNGVNRCSIHGFQTAGVVLYANSLSFTLEQIRVTNNYIFDCLGIVDPDTDITGSVYNARSQNSIIVNNTIVKTHGDAPAFFHQADLGVVLEVFANNIVYFDVGGEAAYAWDIYAPGHPFIANGNLWYVGAGARFGTVQMVAFDDWQALGYDSLGRSDDPLLVDARAGDLRLQANSPAINRAVGDYDITTDREGAMRQIPDIGADEYDATNPSMVLRDRYDNAVTVGRTIEHGGIGVSVPMAYRYTVGNVGGQPLQITGISVPSTSFCSVSVSVDGGTTPFSVAPGADGMQVPAGRGITISVTVLQNQTFAYEVVFQTNDPVRPEFRFFGGGDGIAPTPHMLLHLPYGNPVVEGTTYNVGVLPLNVVTELSFSIENLGGSPLTMVGLAPVGLPLTGRQGCAPAVTDHPTGPIPALNREEFILSVQPTSSSWYFDMEITSNDPDVNRSPYIVRIEGVAFVRPFIDLPESPRETIDFAKVTVGEMSESTFVVTNNGLAPLTISEIGLQDDAANAFEIVDSTPPLPLIGGAVVLNTGETMTLVVAFEPPGSGLFRGALRIKCDHLGTEGTLRYIDLVGQGEGFLRNANPSNGGCVVSGTDGTDGSTTAGLLLLLAALLLPALPLLRRRS
jgi:hypothetical protein